MLNFLKSVFQFIVSLFDEPPKNDLEGFIKFKNPQSKEDLDLAISQYEEMRRIENRLLSRGEYQAAAMIRRSYYV